MLAGHRPSCEYFSLCLKICEKKKYSYLQSKYNVKINFGKHFNKDKRRKKKLSWERLNNTGAAHISLYLIKI